MMYLETKDVEIEALRSFMERMLMAVGCDAGTAATLAHVHLEADLRGVGVQGLNHLINSHLPDFQSGKIDPAGKPEVVREGDAYALIEGNSCSGPIAAIPAAELAAAKARKAGCATVGVRHSHDLFIAGYYAELMAREGTIGFVFSDDVIPVVHPLGGTEPIIGSNPMAIAVPCEGEPFVLDFAPCATLPTYVRYAKRYGKSLPEGVVHDAEGRPVTDPNQVSDGAGHQAHLGAIAPSGNKGYGLLLAIDFLSGALMGCAMGTDHATIPGAHKGHCLMAIDPAMFGGADAFRHAVSARLAQIKGSKAAPGQPEIRAPGERSFATRERSLAEGRVTMDRLCWEDALKTAAALGVEGPG